MRISTFGLVCASLALGAAAPASAQEGHPLKGSWIGTWQSNETHGEFVLVVLDWDGEQVSGLINPGTDNIEIDEASLDPAEWTVRIEADAQDREGDTVRYVIEGRIEDLELPNRYITGTWQHDNGGGAFEIRRQ
ncbi:hypothetical protein [Candidatus Rariloculus sp.]|uniref:hypothetical protein n=1 Tax=Candidatus Rariloculus sp. TaxID=3101265 RepID=UPI003D11B787